VIVLDTIKGQGVEYFEKMFDNHHIRFAGESEMMLKDAIEILEKEVSE